MTPMAALKYLVDRLDQSIYAPYVNFLLFALLVATVVRLLIWLIGEKGCRTFTLGAQGAIKAFKARRRGYAPEVEQFRKRTLPYIDLIGSLYFALIGLLSATFVSLALLASIDHKPPLQALALATIWILGSFYYMRLNLEEASWAYHELKNRKKQSL
jgi:hypothetical protein